MSWCDKLASTPTIGFRLNPEFIPAEHILAGMAPILNENFDEDRGTFDLEALQGFQAVFNTESGFRYSFDQLSASVTFNHRIRAQVASAGPPVMELISKAAPYTDLLRQVKERLARALALMPAIEKRRITRVGIVSVTNVDLDDAPPGIQTLFEQIGAPMGPDVDHFHCAVTTNLRKQNGYLDRCVHTLTMPEAPKKLVTIQLDWQRVLDEPKNISTRAVADLMSAAEMDALEYFERVAEGGLNDGIDRNR